MSSPLRPPNAAPVTSAAMIATIPGARVIEDRSNTVMPTTPMIEPMLRSIGAAFADD
jgi:hypothetical protein